MGKKKIGFWLSLFIFSNMHTYSQELFTEELHWKEKQEFITELYESMKNFVNDTTPVIVENNKMDFSDMNLFDLFNKIFKRKKIDKQLTLQKKERQQEFKSFLESHFIFYDTILELVFFDKDQILEWGKNQLPFSSVYPGDFRIKNSNIFILRVAGCSGLPCWNIYIFKEKDEFWQLIMMSTGAIIKEPFTINADDNLEKIIFRTKSGKIISELSYNVLDNEF
jgi:hypothetical protein